MTLVVAARYRYTSAEVEVVNHNTVKLNGARVPGGWERGSHEDNTEGWFHRPWPWIPPPWARSCTGRLGSFHGTMHTGALCAVCRLAAPPPLPLEINIALYSCTSRSCVLPMDRSTPARRLGCTECSGSCRIYRGLSISQLRCIADVSNNDAKMNQWLTVTVTAWH